MGGGPSYLCVVPARGGSKGVTRKNLRTVGGRPLLAWTIAHAQEPGGDHIRIFVSSDDPEICATAIEWGGEAPVRRPAELATDSAATELVIAHALEALDRLDGYRPTAIVLLQPTSPVRRAGAVARAIHHFESSGADSLVSVTELHPFTWRDLDNAVPDYDPLRRPMRQDLGPEDHRYLENGSIYITRTAAFEHSGCRISGATVLFPMSKLESIDVDTEDDLLLADAILRSGVAL